MGRPRSNRKLSRHDSQRPVGGFECGKSAAIFAGVHERLSSLLQQTLDQAATGCLKTIMAYLQPEVRAPFNVFLHLGNLRLTALWSALKLMDWIRFAANFMKNS
jgi:hypothetical protein